MSAAYRRREAISSLAIEGTQASLSDVLTSEAANALLTGEVAEVRNYLSAFDYGISRLATLPRSLRLVREIHRELMQDVRGRKKTPVASRVTDNGTGQEGSSIEDAIHWPPPPV